MNHFPTDIEAYQTAVQQQLDSYTAAGDDCPARLAAAIRYSVLAPGKRLRPVLALLACEAVSSDWRPAIPVACAVEFIHVYSLIHDDLPSMDDDELRRGQPTCHRQFDEATAILAGDALQMLAMEVIASDMPADLVPQCCQILSQAAGRNQLVGGQVADLSAEGRYGEIEVSQDLDYLKNIHRRKTGALIEASLKLGGVAGRADLDHVRALGTFGRRIGLAFQIVDDCLDVEATPEQMGKNTRKDDTHGKLTYPGLLGLAESRKLAESLVREAIEAISVLNDGSDGTGVRNLRNLAEFVVNRSN